MNGWKAWKCRLRRLPYALLYDFPWSSSHSRITALLALPVAGLVGGVLQGKVLHAWCYGSSRYDGDSFVWDAIEFFGWIGFAIGVASGIALGVARHLMVRATLAGLLGVLSVTLVVRFYSDGRPIYLWGVSATDEFLFLTKPEGWGLFLGGVSALLMAILAHLARCCSGKTRLLVLVLVLGTVASLHAQGMFWSAWNFNHGWYRGCCGSDLRDAPGFVGGLLFPFLAFLVCLVADLAEQFLPRERRGPGIPLTLAAVNLLTLGGLAWCAQVMPWTPQSATSAAAFSSEPDLFVTVHEGETVRLWRIIDHPSPEGPEIIESRKFRMHRAPIRYTTFHVTSDMAAAGSEDGMIDLWTLPALKPYLTIRVPGASFSHIALSPDGNFVAAIDRRSKTRIWELNADDSGRAIASELPGIDNQGRTRYIPIRPVFSPNGRTIIDSGGPSCLSTFDVRTGTPLMKFGEESRFNRGDPPVFSPDGRILACCIGGGAIQLLDLDRDQKRQIQTDLDCAHPIGFTVDGRRLVITNQKQVQILDLTSGKTLKTMARDCSAGNSSLSPDGRWLVMTPRDGEPEVWDLHNLRSTSEWKDRASLR